MTSDSQSNQKTANNGPAFSISGTPTITSDKLNHKNYLAWSASVELWFRSSSNPLCPTHFANEEFTKGAFLNELRDEIKAEVRMMSSVELDILRETA